MTAADPEGQDVDQRIADMTAAVSDLRGRCHRASAFRLADDLIRLARRERRLMPMLRAQFELVNVAQDLFEHHRGRDVSVEMIALLESPERAAQVQADYDEAEYADTRAWMTACAYDNLAKHTA